MQDLPIDFTYVHPRAKEILTHGLYWDCDNPNGPFSTNRVSDTFSEFKIWRNEHKDEDPLDFLPEYTEGGFVFDRNETDTQKIREFYSIHYEFQKHMNAQFGADLFSDLLKGLQSVGVTDVDLPLGEQQNEILEQTANSMGFTALKEQDDQIISAGFGQFILEGIIDSKLKELTRKALVRQLNPFILDSVIMECKDARRNELDIMLNNLQSI